jgi:transposase
VRKARKNYSPQEEVAILRRHLLDKVSVLRLCTQFQLQPTVFYRWLKQLFDNGAAACDASSPLATRATFVSAASIFSRNRGPVNPEKQSRNG